MTEQNTTEVEVNVEQELAEIAPDELTVLKQQADLLGIKYKSNVKLETLKKQILDAMKDDSETVADAADADDKHAKYQQLRDENLKLVRAIVSPMCPTKREHQGEIFTVGNSVLGTVRKYIPFNTEWCIPNFILKQILDKDLQTFVTVKDKLGRATRQPKTIKAYNVTILPMFTPEELAALEKDQTARKSVEQ